jgi:phosphoesterase RecJ-like protein
MSDIKELQQAAALLQGSEKLLIFTHQRPDGDALGSSFGLKFFLESLGKEAVVFIPGAIPHRHTKLFSGYVSELSEAQLDAFDTFVSVDCANPARLGAPEFLTIETLRTRRFINIDHHKGNSMESGFFNLVSGETASCCELLVKIITAAVFAIPERCATPLLTGMMTDTGCFRFSNTSPDTMRYAALLLEAGAELEKIVNAVFFSKPLNQVRFENELMKEHLKFAADNKIAYAYIPPELAQKYAFNIKEDEGLIDLLREIDGVVIAMLLYEGPGGIKISMRSKESRYPVGPVARSFNGGGHDLAAGATFEGSACDAEKALVEKLSQLFE